MTTSASLSGTPGPRLSLRQLVWRLDTTPGLAAMFVVGLAIRLVLAPHAGERGDLHLFGEWVGGLARVGTHRFYANTPGVDYPPGYLYVLWLIGKISSTPGYLLLKLPAMLCDLGVAWVAAVFASRLAPASLTTRLPVRALVVAAVLFNPAVIALSTIWGQVDSVPTLVLLWSLLVLFTGKRSWRSDLAGCLLFALAVAIKPQVAFVLPVVAYALYRRYLHRREGWGVVDGLLTIVWMGLGSLGLWALTGLPFGLGPIALVRFYERASSVYPQTSVNAFNLWGALAPGRNDSTGSDVMRVAEVSALHVGEAAYAVGVVFIVWRMHRAFGRHADEARVLTVGAALSALLAFTLLTRMHERYMFPALVCLAPLLIARPLRLGYAALSALFCANLWYAYATNNAAWRVTDFMYQPWFNWIFGGAAADAWQRRVWSLSVTLAAFAVTWAGLRWAERSKVDPLPP